MVLIIVLYTGTISLSVDGTSELKPYTDSDGVHSAAACVVVVHVNCTAEIRPSYSDTCLHSVEGTLPELS